MAAIRAVMSADARAAFATTGVGLRVIILLRVSVCSYSSVCLWGWSPFIPSSRVRRGLGLDWPQGKLLP